MNIVRRALEEPLRQIVQNAGKEGAVVVEKVRAGKNDSYGFNAQTEVYEDLVAAGVIDPAKVTRTALQNAASIAGLHVDYGSNGFRDSRRRQGKSGNAGWHGRHEWHGHVTCQYHHGMPCRTPKERPRSQKERGLFFCNAICLRSPANGLTNQDAN